jgi:putative ABC transport system substrate-binding protein
MRRREFIAGLGGAAAWPMVARGQQSDKPLIGFLSARSAKESAHLVDAFRKGLAEYGIFEGQNATVDYSWAASHYERLAGRAVVL